MIDQKNDNEISIAEATRRIVKSHPSIIDCMKQGVINFSGLAELIKDDVAKLVNRTRKINMDAIKQALMRYAEEITTKWKSLENEIIEIIAESKLELKNDLVVITVRPIIFLSGEIHVSDLMKNAEFFQLIQGTNSFTIVIDNDFKNKVIKLVKEVNVINIKEDQSAVILKSPLKIIEVPGIVAYITDLFARNNINISNFMSCYTDTLFVINRKESRRAYELLEDKILLLRKIKK
ncbi:MAG: ACT domain-containing protein [Candidatus Lokiarchaeota archaeon]|nr:ACT domain-containing protein [Candidatus Lokiarchaeota archaeon]